MCKNIIDTSTSSPSATSADLHPFGMLDRDQRTIFTFSPMKSTKIDQSYNSINKNCNTNKSTTTQSHLNKWITCDTTTTTTTKTTAEHLCDKEICCTISNINKIIKIGEKFIHRNANTRSQQMHCYHSRDGVAHRRQHRTPISTAQRQTIKYFRTSKFRSHPKILDKKKNEKQKTGTLFADRRFLFSLRLFRVWFSKKLTSSSTKIHKILLIREKQFSQTSVAISVNFVNFVRQRNNSHNSRNTMQKKLYDKIVIIRFG